MKIFKRRCVSEEVQDAKKDATKRKAESRKLKERAIELQTSDRIYAAQLRSHNTANHYDDWLASLLTSRGES